MTDDFLAKIRGEVERRVRAQVERHSRVDPYVDRRNMIHLTVAQERERYKQLADKYEEAGEGPKAEAVLALLDWLPHLESELRRQS